MKSAVELFCNYLCEIVSVITAKIKASQPRSTVYMNGTEATEP